MEYPAAILDFEDGTLSLKDSENIRTRLVSRLLRLSPRFALLGYVSTLARYI